jgi:hypothetical protein
MADRLSAMRGPWIMDSRNDACPYDTNTLFEKLADYQSVKQAVPRTSVDSPSPIRV